MRTGVCNPRFLNVDSTWRAIATGKHKIQNDEVEFLGIHHEKPFFAGGCEDNFILLMRQTLPQGASHFRFVFHSTTRMRNVACLPLNLIRATDSGILKIF